MLKLAVVVLVVLWSGPAAAIIWEFDDGTTQGWAAKEASILGGGPRGFNQFPGGVEDGVWKIDVSPSITEDWPIPNVELISPTIGHDSSLFDQIWVRFRTVHHSPTVGSFWLTWTNEHNLMSPIWGQDDPPERLFRLSGQSDFVYTTEWQEVEFSFVGQDEVVWEGLLRDIRLNFVLAWNEDDVVGEIEIDWIELSGVEEFLQGELPPPHVEYFRFDEAGLFAPPVFYPIAPGIGRAAAYGERAGILTDLDGDGDADLFASWNGERFFTEEGGWTMALNDGEGAFETVRTEGIGPGLIEVLGGDLTGDGQDEIVMSRRAELSGLVTEVWSIEWDLQLEMLIEIDDRGLRDVADWDGDGDGELFVGHTTLEGSTLDVWDVENGMWTDPEVAVAENHSPSRIGDFTGDGMLEVLWLPIAGRANTRIVGALGDDDLQSGEIFEFDAGKEALGVGDFDGDGQVDLLTSLFRAQYGDIKGLAVQRGGVGSVVEETVLYDERLFLLSPVMVRDLDADGVEDWVFVGGDRASGFGVFVEWGGGVNPTRAVERHRLQGDGVEVLSGDVDSDGDLDLVVLDPLLGGVHVLKSSLGEQPTAVQTPTIVQPAQYRLGDSYPNPFNPAVVIPLDLATDAAGVSLTVYDVLGRRVRQLWQGALGAGAHRFTWDGRDEAGRGVAAGVYIYKVEADGQIEAKKTTRLP
ncbi:MAG: FG-GAP-like repeat-containing protein [Gemmatimonadota bacterium]|nr:FG-GAP-like repeat-containing protein [Gemmatimonadota bacterium]